MTGAVATRRPRGLIRWWLRSPLALYRLHIGRFALGELLLYLYGKPHVRVAHRGRRSGQVREVVLEVLDTDKETGEIPVAAMWGPDSDWYQNLRAAEAVEVEIRGRRFAPLQRFLEPVEAQGVLDRYRRRHPVWSRMGGLLIRRPMNAEAMPMVGFRPATRATSR
ncbi:MAG TPA: nitroreductase family deazaflavin-dependent oxidoreductase [Acidimicrobiales bacterium]|nr:nitroreductase family deazaflavin-dependent oxidoreductase [Acidimicrobiales bacterium]